MVRTGLGVDTHAFAPGRPLILGGVEIPHESGLAGHSDADVLTHAIIDALLGAAGLGDIGEHFPDTDPRYADADSIVLLRTVVADSCATASRSRNVDATVVLERPKLAPHRDAIRGRLARALGLAARRRQRQGHDRRGDGLRRARRGRRGAGRRNFDPILGPTWDTVVGTATRCAWRARCRGTCAPKQPVRSARGRAATDMATIQKDRILGFRGEDLYDADGDKIGTIEEIYLDAETNEPEWALVNTGLFGTKRTFVPLHDASEPDGSLRVPIRQGHRQGRARRSTPTASSRSTRRRTLYSHYGLDYSESRSDTGLAEGGTDSGFAAGRDFDADADRDRADRDSRTPTSTATWTAGVDRDRGDRAEGRAGNGGDVSDGAITRSEEELEVGTQRRETGRARLRKYVVTEEVQQTVPVQREEVRLEREPITDANVDAATSGPEISEDEHEVVLHAEEPVAEKRVVPKERVRLETRRRDGRAHRVRRRFARSRSRSTTRGAATADPRARFQPSARTGRPRAGPFACQGADAALRRARTPAPRGVVGTNPCRCTAQSARAARSPSASPASPAARPHVPSERPIPTPPRRPLARRHGRRPPRPRATGKRRPLRSRRAGRRPSPVRRSAWPRGTTASSRRCRPSGGASRSPRSPARGRAWKSTSGARRT